MKKNANKIDPKISKQMLDRQIDKGIEKLSSLMTAKEIKYIIRNLPQKKTLGQDNTKLTQTLPEIEKEGIFHNSFNEISITFILKARQEYYKIGKL